VLERGDAGQGAGFTQGFELKRIQGGGGGLKEKGCMHIKYRVTGGYRKEGKRRVRRGGKASGPLPRAGGGWPFTKNNFSK